MELGSPVKRKRQKASPPGLPLSSQPLSFLRTSLVAKTWAFHTQARRLWWCKPIAYCIPHTRWSGKSCMLEPLTSMLLHRRALALGQHLQRRTHKELQKPIILWNMLFLTPYANHLPEGKTQSNSLNKLS